MLRVAIPELECNAAEDQGEQHDQDGEVHGRDYDGEGQRKRRQERKAPEHEPGLVAIPDWRDGVHHKIAGRRVRREPEEHPDPQIKPVEKDVQKYAEAKNQRPDRHGVEHERIHGSGLPEEIGSERAERLGLPLSTGLSSVTESTGPRRTSRTMIRRPAGNMMRYAAM